MKTFNEKVTKNLKRYYLYFHVENVIVQGTISIRAVSPPYFHSSASHLQSQAGAIHNIL